MSTGIEKNKFPAKQAIPIQDKLTDKKLAKLILCHFKFMISLLSRHAMSLANALN